jgi:protein-tyrosine phosphatase
MKLNGRLIEIELGHFRVGPKPRGGDWLEADIRALSHEGFTFVVSLLTEQENQELGLADEESVCRRNAIDFYSFPIVDRSIPESRSEFEALAEHLLGRIKKGDRGLLHCRVGLGRAPLLGCTILSKAGMTPENAWKMLATSRGQPVPDTQAQMHWVRASQQAFASLDDALSKLLDNDN